MSFPPRRLIASISSRNLSLPRSLGHLSMLSGLVLVIACSVAPAPDKSGGDGSGGMNGAVGGSPSGGGGPFPTGGDLNGMTGGVTGAGGNVVATGGTGGGVDEGPCPSQPVGPEFTLRWEDNFDSFNSGRWTKMTHTFHENSARFFEDQVVAEGGYLKMYLTNNPSGEGDGFRQYRGGEVRTNDEFQYGRFDTCVKWGRGGGVVASFFTYVFGPDGAPWNEIDIEYLGGNPVGIQYNIIWNENGGDNQYDPHFDPLGIDPADDFHQYSMEWVPGEVRFYVDGLLRHTENGHSAAQITRSTTLRMNLWASWTGFAGTFDPGAIPTESWYDWVRAYDYND